MASSRSKRSNLHRVHAPYQTDISMVKFKKAFSVRNLEERTAANGDPLIVLFTHIKPSAHTIVVAGQRKVFDFEKIGFETLKNPSYEIVVLRGEDEHGLHVYEFRGKLWRRATRAFVTGATGATARKQAWGSGEKKMALIPWVGETLTDFEPDPILI